MPDGPRPTAPLIIAGRQGLAFERALMVAFMAVTALASGAVGRESLLDEITASERLQGEIGRLGPWFHNLHLPGGVETAPDHPLGDFPGFKWAELAGALPQDLQGWTALDIGCNAGFYSLELARRGARVTGIDCDGRYLEQARWAAARFGLADRVRFERRQVHELARERRRFDLVLFMGVFYHLRYPVLALDTIARLRPKILVLQSLAAPGLDVAADAAGALDLFELECVNGPDWPKLAFVEGRLAGDPTNWWLPNRAAIIGLLRTAGLRVAAQPNSETYICAPSGEEPCCEEEWRAACGVEARPWPLAGPAAHETS